MGSRDGEEPIPGKGKINGVKKTISKTLSRYYKLRFLPKKIKVSRQLTLLTVTKDEVMPTVP